MHLSRMKIVVTWIAKVSSVSHGFFDSVGYSLVPIR